MKMDVTTIKVTITAVIIGAKVGELSKLATDPGGGGMVPIVMFSDIWNNVQ